MKIKAGAATLTELSVWMVGTLEFIYKGVMV